MLSLKFLKLLKALLISCRYFKNCIIANMKYFLHKKLFKANTIDLICKDNIRLTLLPKLYGLLIKGFLDDLFNDLNCREGILLDLDRDII
jgi:hypothetical protein